jgi:hypothetical protein
VGRASKKRRGWCFIGVLSGLWVFKMKNWIKVFGFMIFKVKKMGIFSVFNFSELKKRKFWLRAKFFRSLRTS